MTVDRTDLSEFDRATSGELETVWWVITADAERGVVRELNVGPLPRTVETEATEGFRRSWVRSRTASGLLSTLISGDLVLTGVRRADSEGGWGIGGNVRLLSRPIVRGTGVGEGSAGSACKVFWESEGCMVEGWASLGRCSSDSSGLEIGRAHV